MKKVKVMLMAVTVLTVVGGALAFKAVKFNISYCTKDSAGSCTSFTTSSRVVPQGQGSLIYAIETANTQQCSGADCNSQLRLAVD